MNQTKMNSKKTIADVKAGRIYRCVHCDAKCNDDYGMSRIATEACYMGRKDKSKMVQNYFCTLSCQRHFYLQETMLPIQTHSQHFKEVLDAKKENYKRRLRNPPSDGCVFEKDTHTYTVTLEHYRNYIAFLTHAIKFLDACIARKSEYELHTLKLKALHVHGPVIEDLHKDGENLNQVLLSHLFIENLEIDHLCC